MWIFLASLLSNDKCVTVRCSEQVKKRCRWLLSFSSEHLSALPGSPADPFLGTPVDANILGAILWIPCSEHLLSVQRKEECLLSHYVSEMCDLSTLLIQFMRWYPRKDLLLFLYLLMARSNFALKECAHWLWHVHPLGLVDY